MFDRMSGFVGIIRMLLLKSCGEDKILQFANPLFWRKSEVFHGGPKVYSNLAARSAAEPGGGLRK